MRRNSIILGVLLACPLASWAWEVDNVTCRYQDLQDVGKETNAETNKRIQAALERVNSGASDLTEELLPPVRFPSKKKVMGSSRSGQSGGGGSSDGDQALTDEKMAQMAEKMRQEREAERLRERAELKFQNTPEGCDPQLALEALKGALASAHFGNMETWAMQANISKCDVKTDQSVYRDFTFLESPIMRGGAGLNSVIQINGVKIGADKLSHFMTEGYEYYLNQRRGQNVSQVIQQGIREEEGGYGLRATGIKSYADMTANYQGYTFWRQVLDGDDPYLKCENGKWKQNRAFRWEDYVIAGMDESINCNKYKSDAMQTKVNTRTTELVRGKDPGSRHQVCPLDPSGCQATLNAIREPAAAAVVIHPNCRRAGESLNGGGQVAGDDSSSTEKDGVQ